MLSTAPPTASKDKPPKSGPQEKKDLRPLIKPAGKQRDRAKLGQRLASALIGRAVDLRQDGLLWDRSTRCILVETGEYWSLVDPETGELSEGMGPRRAANYAYMLARAATSENHTSGMMGAGERPDYPGGTALYKPSLRLDPNWAETMRRRSRKEARVRIKAMTQALPLKERAAINDGRSWRLTWKLVTLTFPHPPAMKTLEQLAIFNGAFRRLCKMELWAKVYGGIKGVEDKLTGHGAHVHGHLLLFSRYMVRAELMQSWREALDAEMDARELPPLTWPDELFSVDIRQVKDNPGKRPDAVSWEIALDEVAKYITKTLDLLEPHPATGAVVSRETLLELCDIGRWPRMFELLGKARSAAAPAKQALLDTSCISAAKLPCSDVNGNQTGEAFAFRQRMERIIGYLWGDGFEPRPADFALDEPNPPPKTSRPDTWRQLMDRTDLATWCQIIDARATKAAAFRLRQLKGLLPRLFLQDLNGTILVNQNLDQF